MFHSCIVQDRQHCVTGICQIFYVNASNIQMSELVISVSFSANLFFFAKLILSLLFFQIENIRRRHNYLPFIMELLKILAEDGKLVGLVEKVIVYS